MFDLNIIAWKYADVEYNPERFPSLVMRIEKAPHELLFSGYSIVLLGIDFHFCLGEPYHFILVLGRGVDGIYRRLPRTETTLAQIENEQLDLDILDIRFPGKRGIEMAKTMHANPAHTQVQTLAVNAYSIVGD